MSDAAGGWAPPPIDLRELVSMVSARRWWVLAVVLVCAGGAVAFALLTRPVYRAATVLIPVTTDRGAGGLGSALGQLGGLAALAGVNVGGSGTITDEALAVLSSRSFTEGFIRDNELMPLLYEERWDAAARRWKAGREPTIGLAVRRFADKVRGVSQDRKTGLVTVQIDWTDRELAAKWANALVDRLNAEMRARAIASANANLEYLEKELGSTRVVETRDTIARLIENQVRQRMLATVNPSYAFRVVDRATAPDRDDPIWPKKKVIAAGGLFGGLLLGLLVAIAPRLFGSTGRAAG